MSALDKQEGGKHYKLPIQPIEYIVKNAIPYREANVIKYVTRHASKNGAEDIKKAIHYLEMIAEDYECEDAEPKDDDLKEDGWIPNPNYGINNVSPIDDDVMCYIRLDNADESSVALNASAWAWDEITHYKIAED